VKQFTILKALGVLLNAASEDVDLNGHQAFNSLIGKMHLQALRSTLIGQNDDGIMDIN